MSLSPEERRRIYEEEKARLEEERAWQGDGGTSSLTPNLAVLLCYLGMWVAGIIFLVFEQKNKLIRFHAAQSVVVFGALMLLSIVLRFVPFAGGLFAVTIGLLTFILWLVLVIKAYRGEFYRLPVIAELAEALLGVVGQKTAGDASVEATSVIAPKEAPRPPRSRTLDVLGSAFSIIFSLAAFIFINFFHKYIAYYSQVNGVWNRQTLVTSAWQTWLPVVDVAIGLSIAGYAILIFSDQRLVRETVRIILGVLVIIALGALLSIFPFDFHPLPISETLVVFLVRMSLVITVAIVAAEALVRFFRLVVAIVQN
jgi:uncharacterized membrane protein